jgi:hypothetical protein
VKTQSNEAARRDQREVGRASLSASQSKDRSFWRSSNQCCCPVLQSIFQCRYQCSSLFGDCWVSARVDKTASWSADTTKRLPIQTWCFCNRRIQVLRRLPLSLHLARFSVVQSKGVSNVFFANSCSSVSRSQAQTQRFDVRQMSAHEGRRWVSLCSSVQLGRGDNQGIQPFLHSSLARHSKALPFAVAGVVVQD